MPEVQIINAKEVQRGLSGAAPMPELCLNIRVGERVYRVIAKPMMHRELGDASRELAFVS